MLKNIFRSLFSRKNPGQGPVNLDNDETSDDVHLAFQYVAQGRFQEAESLYKQVITQEPENITAHMLYADFLRQRGRTREALNSFNTAYELDNDNVQAAFNLASVLSNLNEQSRSEQIYLELIEKRPDWGMAYLGLALLYTAQGNYFKAHEYCKQAVELLPDSAEAHTAFSTIHIALGNINEGILHAEKAITISPGYLPAIKNLAMLYRAKGRDSDARKCYEIILDGPHNDGIKIASALTFPAIISSSNEILESRRRLEENIAELASQNLSVDDPVTEIAATQFLLAHQGLNDRDIQKSIARLHLQVCPRLSKEAPHCSDSSRKKRNGKIRIGFISNFMYNHSIGRVMHGLIKQLPGDKYEKYIFSNKEPFDEVSTSLANSTDGWSVLPVAFEAASNIIAEHELDILFYPDIGMAPLTYFLAFARLAPLQCTTWGHPDTTGIPNMDWYISTEFFEPAASQAHYSEQLFMLKDTAMPGYYYKPEIPDVLSVDRSGFDMNANKYFCPQALFKLHPAIDEIFSGILSRDSDAVIYLVADPVSDASHAASLTNRFSRSIPENQQRIKFVPRTKTREEYLSRLQASDVILDTVHYCGGNTSLEAISCGVPVITLPGEFMRSRHTYAFYRQMNMDDCIASSVQDYIERAIRIASNRTTRKSVSERILESQHALYEDSNAVYQLDAFFTEVLSQQ